MALLENEYVTGNPDLNGGDKLVVVSGCSGGGKSSLLNEMAARGYQVHPEPGRQIVKEQLSIGGDGVPWANTVKFAELCVSRAMFLYNTARPTDKPVLFDRSIIDNVTGLRELGYPVAPYLDEAVRRYRYARRVFMTPPWAELFANDPERRHSFADAQAEYEWLVPAYRAHGYDVVLIPKVSVRERADFLEEQLGYG
jgi:predicted ATPase